MNTATIEAKILTAAGADMVAQVAAGAARARGVTPAIAIVDEGGMLITLRRLDGAQVASVNVAIDKARTAAIFRRPSKDFEDQTLNGRVAALALHGAVALQGGVPIVYAGQVVGAIGVSGASSADEDSELAQLGAQAAATFSELVPSPDPATYLTSQQVAAQFAIGGLLLDTPLYKVDAGRRSGAGEVELHSWVTDILSVQSGTATVVTGGELIDGRQVTAGEYRGRALRGGTTHRLAAGDLLVIPSGVPHWFTEVTNPFLYLVVKVVQPQ